MSISETSFTPTARTTVRRIPARGTFDRGVIHSILDAGFVCHLGFVHEGSPVVLPTGYGRSGDTLYLHGSAASRMFRAAAAGVELCASVTIVDGLVLAKSAYHHSMNYRSVAVFGRARAVTDPGEKIEALRIFTEHALPGRWERVRAPNDLELKATLVLALPLEEVSAKVRTGPPIDDEEDLALPVWAGILPLRIRADDPIPAEGSEGIADAWVRRRMAGSYIE